MKFYTYNSVALIKGLVIALTSLILLENFTGHRNPYLVAKAAKIVRIDDEPYPYYLSRLKYFKKFPDNVTLNFFGYEFDSLPVVSKSFLLTNYQEEEPIDPVSIPETKEDYSRCTDYDSDCIEKFRLLQDNDELIRNLHSVVMFTNPSMIYFQNRFLIAGRNCTSPYPVVYFAWLTLSSHGIYRINGRESFMGVGPGVTEIAGSTIFGEDSRIIVIDENTFAMIGNRYTPTGEQWQGYTRIALSYVGVKADTNKLFLINTTILNPLHPEDNNTHHSEKNWSPFLYHGILHFIYSQQNTFEVVRQVPTQLDQIELVSSVNIKHIKWEYGEMRGGTPARLIGKDKYVAFFHSRLRNPFCESFLDYFFGAYIFSAEIPFTVLSLSKVPIYHPSFWVGDYMGLWMVEYVYYPMDFVFTHLSTGDIVYDILTDTCDTTCLAGYNLTLTLGAQDLEGWIGTMNLLDIYHTLTHYHNVTA